MTSDVVVRAESLGKKYVIGHEAERERYTALRDVITRKTKGLARFAADLFRGTTMVAGEEIEEFWALRDINFEIKRGEVVGIIGRNGAGKTTLLKILSRITEPSEGRVEIDGRVASLLEVGTGFHLELTGRENIYLNGAILGMRRPEIKRKFDEIVAFAEVERFLDTPVKRYSSGMYVRLAFAVAAHLEPEILIVDEVLAVGDSTFQKKCLGKMGDVARLGRTVLFVSHNMHAVQQLTQKCLYLDRGEVLDFDLTPKVVCEYLRTTHQEFTDSVVDLTDWQPRLGNNQAKLLKLEILNAHGQPTTTVPMFEAVKFRLTCHFPKKRDASFGILIHSSAEEPLLDLRNSDTTPPGQEYHGYVLVEATVNALKMYPGEYLLSPWIADYSSRQNLDYVQYCSRITISPPVIEDRILKLDPAWGKIYEESAWVISWRR